MTSGHRVVGPGFAEETLLWSELTRAEVNAARDDGWLVVVPVGSTEQHGAHLPTDTDTHTALMIAIEAARRAGQTLVAPPIPWGFSPVHKPLGATITLRVDTFFALVRDVCNSILDAGFLKVLLVNGHAGNKPPLTTLVTEFMVERGVAIAAVSYFDLSAGVFARERASALGGTGHADEFETSLQLYLRPQLVHMDRAVVRLAQPATSFGYQDMAQAGTATVGYNFAQYYPEGVTGDAVVATERLGGLVFDETASMLAQLMREYRSLEARPTNGESSA